MLPILNKIFKFNPRKCNSAISFSGCVHRDKNKCINMRLVFDSQILLPKNQRGSLKLIYKIKTDTARKNKKNSIKISKMDEKNQYGNAMTKPLPYGCIKKKQKNLSL